MSQRVRAVLIETSPIATLWSKQGYTGPNKASGEKQTSEQAKATKTPPGLDGRYNKRVKLRTQSTCLIIYAILITWPNIWVDALESEQVCAKGPSVN